MAMVCMVCGIGMNEMFLSVNLALLAALALYGPVMEGRQRWQGVVPMIVVGLLSIALFITSPGISNRLAGDSQGFVPMHLVQMLANSVTDFSAYTLRWSFMGLLLIPSSLLMGRLLGPLPRLRHRGFALLAGLLTVYSMTLAFYLTVGDATKDPMRIFTSVLLGFQLVMAAGVLLFLSPTRICTSPKWSAVVAVAMVVGLALPGNNYTLLMQEFCAGNLSAYRAAMTQRYATLREAAASDASWKQATVPQLTAIPTIIQLETEMQPDRSTPHWNRAYEAYFRLDEVRYTTDTITKCDLLFP
jgi:hypothetical protein